MSTDLTRPDRRPEVRYEDSAELRTGIAGWVCTACQRFWGDDEHMARYCCATSMPCGCGNRIEPRSCTACGACRRKKDDERWAAKEKADWDGETPLCEWRGDRFFFTPEDIEDYLDGLDEDGAAVEGLRLVLCEPNNGRCFAMSEFLSDDLPDEDHGGGDLDDAEINKAVNDWIAAHAPLSWDATETAVSPESLRRHVARPEPREEADDGS